MTRRYRVCKKLTDAQFGPVLLCRDTHQPDRLVAVKHVRVPSRSRPEHTNGIGGSGDAGTDPTRRNSCCADQEQVTDNPWQEKEIIELLRKTGGHRHVLQFDEVLEDKQRDRLVFVMEFCAGGDLHDRLLGARPHSRLGDNQALKLVRQIALGLQFLHQNGIAHRDLSLENILLSANGECKISDFGLSTTSDQKCHDTVGKCYYMAPEVVSPTNSEGYCPKAADIWSLGIVLFILLTGSPLCQLATQDEVTIKVLANHGVDPILEHWGIKWMVRDSTLGLLNAMLQICPDNRISLDRLLAHPAFADVVENSASVVI